MSMVMFMVMVVTSHHHVVFMLVHMLVMAGWASHQAIDGAKHGTTNAWSMVWW